MRRYRCALLVVAMLAAAGAAGAKDRDYGKMTCGDFLAAGNNNMAVIIWWLHGYHAGKTGSVAFDDAGPYAKRLGSYCGSHRGENLIDTSEHILSELEHGI